MLRAHVSNGASSYSTLALTSGATYGQQHPVAAHLPNLLASQHLLTDEHGAAAASKTAAISLVNRREPFPILTCLLEHASGLPNAVHISPF